MLPQMKIQTTIRYLIMHVYGTFSVVDYSPQALTVYTITCSYCVLVWHVLPRG